MGANILEEKQNKIEIKETLKKSYYTSVCGIIFGVFLLIIITIAVTIMGETQKNRNFNE